MLVQREGEKGFFGKSTICELDENDWEENKLDIHLIYYCFVWSVLDFLDSSWRLPFGLATLALVIIEGAIVIGLPNYALRDGKC